MQVYQVTRVSNNDYPDDDNFFVGPDDSAALFHNTVMVTVEKYGKEDPEAVIQRVSIALRAQGFVRVEVVASTKMWESRNSRLTSLPQVCGWTLSEWMQKKETKS